MRKGSLRNHFIGAFALLAALIAAGALGGLWASAGLKARSDQAAQLGELRHRGASFLRNALELQLSVADYVRTGDDFNAQAYAKTLTALRSGLAEAGKTDARDLQVDRLKEASGLLDKWDLEYAQPLLAAKKRLVDLKVGSLPDVSKGEKHIRDYKELIAEYSSDTGEDIKSKRNEMTFGFSRLNLLILGGAAVALAGALALLINFLTTVAKPVLGIAAWVKALHAGKNFTLEINSNDEIGDLADAFSSMGESLKLARRDFQEMAELPEANPNPILQLKGVSEVVYANAAAKALCERTNLTPPELLPGDLEGLLEPVLGKDAVVHKERDFSGAKYMFFFRTHASDAPTFVVAFLAAARATPKK